MTGRSQNILQKFFSSESSGGILLILSAILAVIVANSPVASTYFDGLHAYLGPMSVQHWINDALMAIFFLMVGLEIKREMVDGHLSSWSRRILPGVAAAAGMAMPALVYLSFNAGGASHGWAIPAATDIAFALGVIALLGPRVPVSLKVFLAALAIIDDLGAVIVIGLFYTANVSMVDLGCAAGVFVALLAMNKFGVKRLLPYLLLGVALWFFTYRSGVHATIAGVLLALTIPMRDEVGDQDHGPLHRLEHFLVQPVAFFIIPLFGFANAGVSFAGMGVDALTAPVTLGVALGLLVGKLVGIFGIVFIMVRSGMAGLPSGSTWLQMFGTCLLCGIGFTMSLFISLLAFNEPLLQDEGKIGILMGSIVAGVAGYLVLRFASQKPSVSRP